MIRARRQQLCLIELVAWGVLYYAFSAFMPAMKAETSWNSATLAAGFSVAILISGLAAPLAGIWIDRHGSRSLMISATAVSVAGVLLWSQAYTMPLYLSAWMLLPTLDTYGRKVIWSHPAFAKRSIFVRNDQEFIRVSLGER